MALIRMEGRKAKSERFWSRENDGVGSKQASLSKGCGKKRKTKVLVRVREGKVVSRQAEQGRETGGSYDENSKQRCCEA